MKIKLKPSRKQVTLVLSARQKRQIERILGYRFEASIFNEGLLLHSTKQKYRLNDLMIEMGSNFNHLDKSDSISSVINT
ncbi:MAG: hypothetical protein SFU55_11695 [Methylophilus sp.]|nr:hypothetical protein [Methylophilus sp.]